MSPSNGPHIMFVSNVSADDRAVYEEIFARLWRLYCERRDALQWGQETVALVVADSGVDPTEGDAATGNDGEPRTAGSAHIEASTEVLPGKPRRVRVTFNHTSLLGVPCPEGFDPTVLRLTQTIKTIVVAAHELGHVLTVREAVVETHREVRDVLVPWFECWAEATAMVDAPTVMGDMEVVGANDYSRIQRALVNQYLDARSGGEASGASDQDDNEAEEESELDPAIRRWWIFFLLQFPARMLSGPEPISAVLDHPLWETALDAPQNRAAFVGLFETYRSTPLPVPDAASYLQARRAILEATVAALQASDEPDLAGGLIAAIANDDPEVQ